MARISQVLIDKLPAGGPSAGWGRMYAVLMDDPLICDVMEGATLMDDGTVLVEGVQGMTASPARLHCLHAALQQLQAEHCLYRNNPAVDRAVVRMAAILAQTGSTSEANERKERPQQPSGSNNDELEVTYLVPKEHKIPHRRDQRSAPSPRMFKAD